MEFYYSYEFDNFFEGPKGFIKLGEFIDKTHERFNELKTTRADKLRRSLNHTEISQSTKIKIN